MHTSGSICWAQGLGLVLHGLTNAPETRAPPKHEPGTGGGSGHGESTHSPRYKMRRRWPSEQLSIPGANREREAIKRWVWSVIGWLNEAPN